MGPSRYNAFAGRSLGAAVVLDASACERRAALPDDDLAFTLATNGGRPVTGRRLVEVSGLGFHFGEVFSAWEDFNACLDL
jgi:hypothetical protein